MHLTVPIDVFKSCSTKIVFKKSPCLFVISACDSRLFYLNTAHHPKVHVLRFSYTVKWGIDLSVSGTELGFGRLAKLKCQSSEDEYWN